MGIRTFRPLKRSIKESKTAWVDILRDHVGGLKTMGEIRVKVRFENEMDAGLRAAGRLAKKKVRAAEVDAVVDTGAVMMLLPEDLVEKLGLRITGKSVVALADERRVEMKRASALSVTIGDRTMAIDCLVGPPGCEILIGQLIMEGLDLIADPAKRTLTPRPESPWLPTLKMKTVARPETLVTA